MIALRAFARRVPSTVSRQSIQTFSKVSSARIHPSRPPQSWKPTTSAWSSAFSTSVVLRAEIAEGTVDQELSAKLQNELQLEQDISGSDVLPPNLQEYLDNSPFQIHDKPGEEEIVLTRSFGNEKIRIAFTIADLRDLDSNDLDQYSEDRALPDEQDGSEVPNVQSGGAQSKGITSPGGAKGGFETSPESSASPTEEDDEIAGDDQEPNFPARLHVTIEKHGAPGAMQIEAIAQDGMINIENVYYFQKAEFADAKTAEQDWARRLLYSGPPFGNLDQDLQVLLERYLDERGINTALALWVPEYIDLKEQREYQNWLSDMKSFVDA